MPLDWSKITVQSKAKKRNYKQWALMGVTLYAGFMAGILWPDKPCDETCRNEIIEQELTLTIGQLNQPWTPKPVKKPI